MIKTVNRDQAEHYRWGDNCDGWHLVKNEMLSVIEERMPPGTSEVFHHHRRAQQFFFVLSGRAEMDVGGETVAINTGEGVHIRPELVHRIRNSSLEYLHFLVISQPPSHGDRVTEEEQFGRG